MTRHRRGRPRRGRLLRAVAGVVAVLTAVVVVNALGRMASAQQQPDAELVALGRQLFGTDCAICHGDAGRGIQNQGPSLVGSGPAATDFMLRTGRMPLESPRERLSRRTPRYSPREREALVAYVTTFAGDEPAIPEVNPSAGDLGAGRGAFVAQCAACHGATGAGIAVGQRDIAPSLHRAEPIEIAEAIRTGPGVMPVFGESTLPQEELDSVIAWVEELRGRESPGGISVGRSGPVAEGFVAWLVGMGLLTVVIYLLGDREPPRGAGAGEQDGGSDV